MVEEPGIFDEVPAEIKVQFSKGKYDKGPMRFVNVGKPVIFKGKSWADASESIAAYARHHGYWYTML